MKTYKIGIVGYGHVGRAMHRLFEDWVYAIHDPFVPIPDSVKSGQTAVNDCDLAIVCVPTPEAPAGDCDTSIVESSVGWCTAPLILIKSTVTVGTTRRLAEKYKKKIVFSPEYFGEYPYQDRLEMFRDPRLWPFQIFGGQPRETSACVEIFKARLSPETSFFQTDYETAELTKYMENAFLALKVTFANEMYEVAGRFGVSYDTLRELWALDPRVGPMGKRHTAVYEKNRGYGGKCLPKDLRALIKAAVDKGYRPSLLQQVDRCNLVFQGKTIPPDKDPSKSSHCYLPPSDGYMHYGSFAGRFDDSH